MRHGLTRYLSVRFSLSPNSCVEQRNFINQSLWILKLARLLVRLRKSYQSKRKIQRTQPIAMPTAELDSVNRIRIMTDWTPDTHTLQVQRGEPHVCARRSYLPSSSSCMSTAPFTQFVFSVFFGGDVGESKHSILLWMSKPMQRCGMLLSNDTEEKESDLDQRWANSSCWFLLLPVRVGWTLCCSWRCIVPLLKIMKRNH